MMLGITTMQAQSWNEWNGNNILEHVGVGIGVGTTGVTIDVGTDITDYLTLRGGVDICPKFSMDFDVNTQFETSFDKSLVPARYALPKDKVKIKAETALGAGHLLLDIHPFKTAFRIILPLRNRANRISKASLLDIDKELEIAIVQKMIFCSIDSFIKINLSTICK